ncbi:MAG: sensor histidine kinase [Paracoccaceae bacterium]
MDPRRELIRLRKVEYGIPAEVTVRLGAICIGAITLALNTDWGFVWAWIAGYFGAHAAFLGFVLWRTNKARPRDVYIAAGLSLVVIAAFVWLPVTLLIQTDVAMVLPAALALICTAVFLIWRSDTLLVVVIGQIIIAAVTLAVPVWYFIQDVTNTLPKIVMVICHLATISYFGLALLTGRMRRLLRREAFERSAQARKMEAVGQLAGGVAHDFNNILTAIQGNLELYGALQQGTEKDEVVENAHAAALRAAQLVQHLLAYARHAPMHRDHHDVADLFRNVEKLSRRLIPTSVELRFIAPDPPISVTTDENQLVTALINLIVNARDAMPTGGRLDLTAHGETIFTPRVISDGATLAKGDYLRIVVTDSGPGIPQATLSRIFEPFFTTKAVGEGSGLGLSMVSGFAQQSGGGVAVDSGDWGTAISVFLPTDKQLSASGHSHVGPGHPVKTSATVKTPD